MISYIFGLPIYIGTFAEPQKVLEEIKMCQTIPKPPVCRSEFVEILGRKPDDDEGAIFDLRNYTHITKYINSEIDIHIKKFLDELNIKNLNITTQMCGKLNCKGNCSDLWFSTYQIGQYTKQHWHLEDADSVNFCKPMEAMFSFNYFVKYDYEKDAGFFFVNPSPIHDLYNEIEDSVPQLKKDTQLQIKEGEIVLFPSCLLHYVKRQNVIGPRITLSGNLYKVGWCSS